MSVGNAGFDRDLVLNMWFAGDPVDKIAAANGTLINNSIVSFVSRCRAEGDPRAINRSQQSGFRGRIKENMQRARRLKMLERFPATVADLDRAVAAYRGPVQHLPAGIHGGHTPACLKWLGF